MRLFIHRDLGKQYGYALRAVKVPIQLHIERYPTADAESIPDRRWIKEATAEGYVLITRDGDIRRTQTELAAVIAANARMFVLETGNATPFDYLRATMLAWPKLLEIEAAEAPPFMFGIRRNGRVLRRYPPAA